MPLKKPSKSGNNSGLFEYLNQSILDTFFSFLLLFASKCCLGLSECYSRAFLVDKLIKIILSGIFTLHQH